MRLKLMNRLFIVQFFIQVIRIAWTSLIKSGIYSITIEVVYNDTQRVSAILQARH